MLGGFGGFPEKDATHGNNRNCCICSLARLIRLFRFEISVVLRDYATMPSDL